MPHLDKSKKYRLLTRNDFDGLVCAALLQEQKLIDSIKFVHPKDMQDGKIRVTGHDITTNLPYVKGVALAFDHHHSEVLRVGSQLNHVINDVAPSCARLVYDFFGGVQGFPGFSTELMDAVDKSDSANFSPEDVLSPSGWPLVNFILDSRGGVEQSGSFETPTDDFLANIIGYFRTDTLAEMLQRPDVAERVALYFKQQKDFKEQVKRCAKVMNNLLYVDLTKEDKLFGGNRFLIYALFPVTNISLTRTYSQKRDKHIFAVGKSIFNRTSKTNVGELMYQYGGGGHHAAGTCQISPQNADQVEKELIETIIADG